MTQATEIKCREQDPAYAMYREWTEARADWNSLSEKDDWSAPHMKELERRRDAVEDAAFEKAPETAPQAALLALIIWEIQGPSFREDSPQHRMELELPHVVPLLRLKEWAEGVLTK